MMEDGTITGQNLLKQKNYQTQFNRLNKALSNQFYLEAMFIVYAIIEDRTEAVLRYRGGQGKAKLTLDKKLTRIASMTQEENDLCGKYFQADFLESIRAWKTARNAKVHALMRELQSTQELTDLAEEGRTLARALCTKAGNYKRALERSKRKLEQQ